MLLTSCRNRLLKNICASVQVRHYLYYSFCVSFIWPSFVLNGFVDCFWVRKARGRGMYITAGWVHEKQSTELSLSCHKRFIWSKTSFTLMERNLRQDFFKRSTCASKLDWCFCLRKTWGRAYLFCCNICGLVVGWIFPYRRTERSQASSFSSFWNRWPW